MEENKKINNNDLEQVTGGVNENALPIDTREPMEEIIKKEMEKQKAKARKRLAPEIIPPTHWEDDSHPREDRAVDRYPKDRSHIRTR